MADVKISGLPASTVPLAGTEVLPIVQGGQTRQVSIANVTAGRAVSALSVTTDTNKAASSAGGTLQSNNGTACLQWGAGGGSNVILDGGVSLTAANVAVTLSPTGTGTVAINPATASTMNNVAIGGTTPLAGAFTTATANSFIPNSATIPTNGVYLPAANSVGIAANSNERARFFASGGVSIGNTTDPGATNLSVTGTGVFGKDGQFNGVVAGLGNGQVSTNTILGFGNLNASCTGDRNVMMGYTAGTSNTTGLANTFLGFQCGYANTIGNQNTAIGGNRPGNQGAALSSNVSGSDNVAVGTASLAVATGSQNTAVGSASGYTATSGSNNGFFGWASTPSSVTVSDEITLGNSSIATLRCQVTTITSLSDARDKTNIQPIQAGLDFVSKLKPVSFDWNMRDGGKVGEFDTGFIAQDLKQTQIDTGIEIPGLVYEENPEKLEAGYGKLLPVLVKAIQELKAEFDAYVASHP